MKEKIRIILADDHPIFRDGIKSLLHTHDGIQVVGEVSQAQELLELLPQTPADVIIMDISMPGRSGIELCHQVKEAYPGIKVIILSMHTDEEFVINAVKSGACGYLPKDTTKDELLEAIHAVYYGGEYFSKSVAQNFIKNYFRNYKLEQILLEDKQLTNRELEVLRFVASGLTVKEISEKLFISSKTVDSHKNNIMQKLKLKNTAEMVLYAVKNKIVEV